MSSPDVAAGPLAAPRRWITDPVIPLLLLTAGGVVLAASGDPATWAVLGGLAGYSLSGSV